MGIHAVIQAVLDNVRVSKVENYYFRVMKEKTTAAVVAGGENTRALP